MASFAKGYIEGVERGAEAALHFSPFTAPAAAGLDATEEVAGWVGVDMPAPDHPYTPVRESNEDYVKTRVSEAVEIPDMPDFPDPDETVSKLSLYAKVLLAFVGIYVLGQLFDINLGDSTGQ